jgi:hypothetical protein
VGKAGYTRGTDVEVDAQDRIVLREGTCPRVFTFDRWQGRVTDRQSARTTVRLDHSTTVTAVYRELKREFHVAVNGQDTWSGRLDKPNPAGTDGPFATLNQARKAIRQEKHKSGGKLPCPMWVYLHEGQYPLEEPFVLGPEDSGAPDCPVVYSASLAKSPS